MDPVGRGPLEVQAFLQQLPRQRQESRNEASAVDPAGRCLLEVRAPVGRGLLEVQAFLQHLPHLPYLPHLPHSRQKGKGASAVAIADFIFARDEKSTTRGERKVTLGWSV